MLQGCVNCIFVLFILILLSPVNAREIYKWTDSDGNVHYGENPPDTGSQRIKLMYRGGVDKVDVPARQQSPSTDNRAQRDKIIKAMEADRLARQEKRQKEKKQRHDRKMQCAQARDNLRRYRSAGGLYKIQADGKRQILSDSARQERHKLKSWSYRSNNTVNKQW